MDILRYTNPSDPTKLEAAEIVNGLNKILWVERYRMAGEFKLVANEDSGIRQALPLGSFISHSETLEVMIVENHEISDDRGKRTEVTVSGRGYETLLENRIVGSNQNFPIISGTADYILPSGYTWNQALALIEDHVLASKVIRSGDAIDYLQVLAQVTTTSDMVARALKRGSVYAHLMELLSIDNLGLKVVRPGAYSPLAPGSPDTALVIHAGVNRTATVVFSHDSGEIESADYLWSNKPKKNAALISGKWVETFISTIDSKYARRTMFVDASDIDSDFTDVPSGADLVAVIAAMEQRGVETLIAQKAVSLTKAEVNKDNLNSTYRVDFDLGDIVTVIGDYNETSTMRIDEYVEILDETGRTSYPTLTMQ